MTGGQEKNFSTLGPKLRENRAQQYYGDKSLQIRVETTNYTEVKAHLGQIDCSKWTHILVKYILVECSLILVLRNEWK